MIAQQHKQGSKLTKEQMELIANKNKQVSEGVLPRNKFGIKSLEQPKNVVAQIKLAQKAENRVFTRTKNRTKIEVRRLEERYEDPYERVGKARSHIGDLKYGTVTYGDGDRGDGQGP
jgi:cell division protein FtsB